MLGKTEESNRKERRDFAKERKEKALRIFAVSSCPNYLNSPQQEENQNDHEDQAESAAWSIAPISAVRPPRHRAQKQDNQDNHQD